MDATTAIVATVILIALEFGLGIFRLQSRLDRIIGQLENANDTLASLLLHAESSSDSEIDDIDPTC